MKKEAAANVTPVRQRTQYTCMAASLMMCLKALGRENLDEDTVNEVMGAQPMQGASWERAFAAAQHFGFRTVLMCPCTVTQLKAWTDQGFPVMIAWNPEGREWSHASVVFDVDADGNVSVADPNIPDPEQTVRVVSKDEFYHKWFEKWPNYLVRRPAMAVMPEVTTDGKQVLASQKKAFEIYVDDDGYAHDDEGNSWFVGKQYAGQHGGLHSRIPMEDQGGGHRPQNRVSPAVGREMTRLLDLSDKAHDSGNKWEQDFLISVARQLRYKGVLSPKQQALVDKLTKKYTKTASDDDGRPLITESESEIVNRMVGLSETLHGNIMDLAGALSAAEAARNEGTDEFTSFVDTASDMWPFGIPVNDLVREVGVWRDDIFSKARPLWDSNFDFEIPATVENAQADERQVFALAQRWVLKQGR